MNIGFGPRIGYWAGWIVPPGDAARPARRPPRSGRRSQPPARARRFRRRGRLCRRRLRARGARRRASLARSSSSPPASCAIASSARAADARRRPHAARVARRPHRRARSTSRSETCRSASASCAGRTVVATICESGYRSSLASSLLARAGRPRRQRRATARRPIGMLEWIGQRSRFRLGPGQDRIRM